MVLTWHAAWPRGCTWRVNGAGASGSYSRGFGRRVKARVEDSDKVLFGVL